MLPAVHATTTSSAVGPVHREDLTGVAFRRQTGVASVPSAGKRRGPSGPPPDGAKPTGAARPSRVRAAGARLEAQAVVPARADRGGEGAGRNAANRGPRRPRTATIEARLTALAASRPELDDELADRARRDGALPGWLR